MWFVNSCNFKDASMGDPGHRGVNDFEPHPMMCGSKSLLFMCWSMMWFVVPSFIFFKQSISILNRLTLSIALRMGQSSSDSFDLGQSIDLSFTKSLPTTQVSRGGFYGREKLTNFLPAGGAPIHPIGCSRYIHWLRGLSHQPDH